MKKIKLIKNYDGTKMRKKIKNPYDLPPIRMPYMGKDVPHIVIEVNQKCNIRCHACYKNKSSYTKPIKQVKEEIDLAISKRNLSVITLAGGEAALHPELPEIIEYVTEKGIYCQILSNGLCLTDELLQSYKIAGLKKVYVHIDSLQKRPDAKVITNEKSLHKLREKIGAKIRKADLACALAFTLYKKNFEELPEIVDFVTRSKNFQRLLVTCCTDFTKIAEKFGSFQESDKDQPGKLNPEVVVSNNDVKKSLLENLKMKPYAFVASSHNLKSQRWIFYYSFTITTPTGDCFQMHLQPSFGRIVKFANYYSKKRHGRYPFGRPIDGAKAVMLCLVYGLVSCKISTFLKVLFWLNNLRKPGSQINQKSYVFQSGPNVTKNGEIEHCKSCPDATIRNGELIPVCVADFKYPLPTEN